MKSRLMFRDVLVAGEVRPAPPHLELLGRHELLPPDFLEVGPGHAKEVLRQLQGLIEATAIQSCALARFGIQLVRKRMLLSIGFHGLALSAQIVETCKY